MRKQGNDTNRPQVEGKKGKRRTLTVLGYALMIVFLLIVLPVVLPAIFGYHTYTVRQATFQSMAASYILRASPTIPMSREI